MDNGTHQDYKGFGKSNELPEGTALQLPAGIILTEIIGYSELDTMYCANTTLDDQLGFGDGLVDLCIGFENRANSPIRVTLPPGLIFISKNLQVQNGMLIERISFEVPAKTRFFKPIAACCINTPRNPASYGREYKLGPITNVKPVVDLLLFLETKDLHADEQQGAFAITALRGLANEGKISDFTQKEILKIKNK